MLLCQPPVLSDRCTSSILSYLFSCIGSTFNELFTLTSLNNIRLTNSVSPNLVHICLYLAHYLDLHHVSIKHAIPISDIKLSSNTTRNIHSTITFASHSSKVLQPVSPLFGSFLTFSTSQSYLPIPFCLIFKSSYSFWHHASAPPP